MVDFLPYLVVLFFLAALLRIDFFFTILYLFVALYVLSRVWLQHAVAHLRAERRFTPRAFVGDEVQVELRVANTGRLPVPWLELYDSLSVEVMSPPHYRQAISLAPGEERRFDYRLVCRKRGYHPVGPLTLRTGDLLAILPGRQIEVAEDFIIVYPQVVPLQRLGLPTLSPQVALPTPTHLFEDPSRIMGVRDYRRGDSLRRIHWTATASAGRLLVKQYQPAIAREALICLDLNREGYGDRHRATASELAVVAAASLARHAIVHEGLPAGLATTAHDPLVDDQVSFFLPPRSERGYLMSILEVLARAQLTSAATFADLLRGASVRLAWGTTLVLITGREREGLLDVLVSLQRAGFAIALALVQPAQPSPAFRGRAELLSIPIHHVWSKEDVEVWV
jgi:uncharacterized protein (DUF58 family)